MENWKVILTVIALIIIGYVLYNVVPFKYSSNVPPLLNISFGELRAIKQKMKDEKITEEEKQALIKREEEIYLLLENFFGPGIKHELV